MAISDARRRANDKWRGKFEEIRFRVPKGEKEIIQKRYGLNNLKSQTQKEIAESLNISRSYVSRIEKRALGKIYREFIKNQKNI